jgi:HSP20 family molecular chaperone IbpA
MHTILNPKNSDRRVRGAELTETGFRKPVYDSQSQGDSMKLVVYIPGVDAAGVSIEASGSDLTVTARKTRFVRVNFPSLNLEGSQRDYRLRLRLGRAFAFEAMQAEMHDGVLVVRLPRRAGEMAGPSPRFQRVA